jgi:peptide/nickel transport system ATP-binding protein
MPRLDRPGGQRLIPILGTPPSLINVPPGCPFHPRCRYAELNDGASETVVPPMVEAEPGHLVACHLARQVRHRIWDTEVGPRLMVEEPG